MKDNQLPPQTKGFSLDQSDDLSLCNENAAFFFCGVDNLTIEKAKFKNVKQYALRLFDIENSRFKGLRQEDGELSRLALRPA